MFAFPELRAGTPTKYDRLTVYPLYSPGVAATSDYALSQKAIASGLAVVEETSEGGSVPKLAVSISAPLPVLFLEGEELRGAKQNRVLNASLLLAGESRTEIPVSCVEQGRWGYRTKSFQSMGTHAAPNLRKVLKRSATQSVRAGLGHRSDQGDVWAEVSRQMHCTGVGSPTMAMSDTFDAHSASIETAKERVAYPAEAVGMIVAIGGRVTALDVFESPSVCEEVWGGFLSGAILEALEAGGVEGEPDVALALKAFRDGPWEANETVGIGAEFRAVPEGGAWYGSALEYRGRLLHGSLVFA